MDWKRAGAGLRPPWNKPWWKTGRTKRRSTTAITVEPRAASSFGHRCRQEQELRDFRLKVVSLDF